MSRETLALWATVALCALIAIVDPAERFNHWRRSRRRAHHATGRGKPGTHAQAQGDVGHLNVESVRREGAAPAVVAPSPVMIVCGCEVLVDHPIPVSNAMLLGHYLSQASKAPLVRA